MQRADICGTILGMDGIFLTTTPLILFITAFTLSLLFNKLTIYLAEKWGIVDQPNERKIHEHPIPRWGGAAIFLSFWISALPILIDGSFLTAVFGGSLLLFIVGTIDDKKGIQPIVKLLSQLTASTIFVLISNVQFPILNLPFHITLRFPPIAGEILAIIWITGIINAFNLIDGLDGLASGLAIIALVGFSAITSSHIVTILSVILAGSILGFMFYNYPPAKEFMGDTGSMFIGFIIGTFSLASGGKTFSFYSIFLPLVLVLIPVLDVSWAFMRRIVNRAPPFQADKLHIHHRLLMLNLEKREALVTLLLISATTAIIGIFITSSADILLFISFIILVSGIVIFLLVAGRYLQLPQLINDMRNASEKIIVKRKQKKKPVLLEILAYTLIAGYYVWIIYRSVGLIHAIVLVDLVFIIIIVFTFRLTIKEERNIGVVLFLSGIFLLANYYVFLLKVPTFSIFARKDIILLLIALFILYEIFFLFYYHVLIPYPEDVLFFYVILVTGPLVGKIAPSWWTSIIVVGTMYLGVKLIFLKLEERKWNGKL